MKVFFTCSARNILKFEKNYRLIRNEIINLGHNINRDWIDYPINLAKRKTSGISSFKMYPEVMTAITTADAVVVDASVRSMSLGHQLTYAMQHNRPILVVHYVKREKKIPQLFIQGTNYKDLNVYGYRSLKEIPEILKKFFSKYKDQPTKRFNLVLTEAYNNYLNWASYNYKKTKTDVIHEAIDNAMEKDSAYKNLMTKKT